MHGSLTLENSEQFHLQSSDSTMQHVLGARGVSSHFEYWVQAIVACIILILILYLISIIIIIINYTSVNFEPLFV